MSAWNNVEHRVFVCSCGGTLDHAIFVSHDTDWAGDDQDRPALYIHAGLNPVSGFWKRLGLAAKYVLGLDHNWEYVETMLYDKELVDFIEFVNRSKAARK